MRRLAHRLLDHADRVMPAARRPWIRAMRAELVYVRGSLPAITFALGCVRASYAQRIISMSLFVAITRWTIALLGLAQAAFLSVAVVILVLLKSNPRVTAADLGSDPGTIETLGFIRAYPAWEVGVMLLVAVLLAVGVYLLIRHRRAAFKVLAAGVAAASVLTLIDLRLPHFADIRFEGPQDLAINLLVPLLLLVPVWWLNRRDPVA